MTERLVTIPQQQEPAIAQFPFITQLLWALMGSLVAGVVEETSFRGYLQKPIEERHGPEIAMLVTGSLFGFAHFTHPEVGLILLPYYLLARYRGLPHYRNCRSCSVFRSCQGEELVKR